MLSSCPSMLEPPLRGRGLGGMGYLILEGGLSVTSEREEKRATTILCALASKFECPLCVTCEIYVRYGWPARFDGFEEILLLHQRLQQLIRLHFFPRHLECFGVTWGARCELFSVIDED